MADSKRESQRIVVGGGAKEAISNAAPLPPPLTEAGGRMIRSGSLYAALPNKPGFFDDMVINLFNRNTTHHKTDLLTD